MSYEKCNKPYDNKSKNEYGYKINHKSDVI